jgi:glycosyltransferase involved in cell wall biosynthesis
MAKVNVIIPTYNYGRYLPRAIESVLAQTYKDIEILVVDDGSTDNTAKISEGYKEKGVKYFKHEHNKGLSAARNTGIKNTSGQFIAFLDSDDEWAPEKLALQVELLEKGSVEVGLIYTDVKYIKMRPEVKAVTLFPAELSRPDYKILVDTVLIEMLYLHPVETSGEAFTRLLEANLSTGSSSTVLARRKCFEDVGLFDENLKYGEDWEMWLRIAKAYKVGCVNKVLAACWTHGVNMSANKRAMILGREQVLIKHYDAYVAHPNIHSMQYYKLGIFCYKEGMMGRGRKHFLKAIKFSSWSDLIFKLKCTVQYLVSFCGPLIYIKIRKRFIDN